MYATPPPPSPLPQHSIIARALLALAGRDGGVPQDWQAYESRYGAGGGGAYDGVLAYAEQSQVPTAAAGG